MSTARQFAAAVVVSCVAAWGVVGCGTPGSPLPPSLNLPQRVTDLDAVRAGRQVTLTWTMPRRTTDKILLKGPVTMRACWSERKSECVPQWEKAFAPGEAASWTVSLPAALISGTPRPARLAVEAINRNNRSAGLSNTAAIVAGEAPGGVEGLAAKLSKDGVVLRWSAGNAQDAVRLHRVLVSAAKETGEKGLLKAPREAATQGLLVDHDAGVALDKDIRFGQVYEYRAQRVARVEVDGQVRELAGPVSAPVRVDAQDVFPPAAPMGLAVVATAPTGGTAASIDLSWEPDSDTDVAGYRVYRREGAGGWERISGEQLVAGPAFHDTNVQPGRTYTYAVGAVDQRGNESARSAEASESVPQP